MQTYQEEEERRSRNQMPGICMKNLFKSKVALLCVSIYFILVNTKTNTFAFRIEKLWDEMSISEHERGCFRDNVKLKDNQSGPSKVVLKHIALEIQALKKHKADTLELLKLIDLRERHLEELRRVIERETNGTKGRHVLLKNVDKLATIIRLTTMDIVEFIDQRWRVRFR